MPKKFKWNRWELSDTLRKERNAVLKGELRDRNYPTPLDCCKKTCLKFCSACVLGVCEVAVQACGDS